MLYGKSQMDNNPTMPFKKRILSWTKKFFLRALAFLVISMIVIGVPLNCVDGFIEWRKNVAVKDAPIVNGLIADRQLIIYKGVVQGADFTIRVENEDVLVHAKTQRCLLNIPEHAKFRYSGDPNREVFLFEHEKNPFWEFVLCLILTLLLSLPLAYHIIFHEVKGYLSSHIG
jgi:hypothetical protein